MVRIIGGDDGFYRLDFKPRNAKELMFRSGKWTQLVDAQRARKRLVESRKGREEMPSIEALVRDASAQNWRVDITQFGGIDCLDLEKDDVGLRVLMEADQVIGLDISASYQVTEDNHLALIPIRGVKAIRRYLNLYPVHV